MKNGTDVKIVLLVLYNHRYDKNIPLIEEHYKGRFTNIFHLIPFYDGDKENVIPVYENSYQFSSYIAQAYQHVKKLGFTHYFIVADDLYLNPKIEENNLFESIGMDVNQCFLPYFFRIDEGPHGWWYHLKCYAFSYNPIQRGIEVEKMLPSIGEAKDAFSVYGIDIKNLSCEKSLEFYNSIHNRQFSSGYERSDMLRRIQSSTSSYNYPLVGGYSDIMLLTEEVMPKFAHYCGIFAATKLFCEIAIPTAMVLATDKMITEKDTKLEGVTFGGEERTQICIKYDYSLSKLKSEFPEDKFYFHPIKLSQWK